MRPRITSPLSLCDQVSGLTHWTRDEDRSALDICLEQGRRAAFVIRSPVMNVNVCSVRLC